jgi:hypothetical protein
MSGALGFNPIGSFPIGGQVVNAIGREAIYSTFFAQLKSILLVSNGGPFGYMGRRAVALGGLASEQYPAFFFLEIGEIYDRHVLIRPARVTLQASGVIQSMHGIIPDDSSTADINNLADAVESAINSACGRTAQNTLNGLVQEAWIDSRQLVLPATYSNQWSEQILGITMVLPHSR